MNEYRTSLAGYGADRMSGLISGQIFPNLDTALSDARIGKMICPYCGEQIPLEFSVTKGNTTSGYGRCTEGDEFLARIQHYRQEGDTRKVKRLVYEMSDDLWDTYQQAKNTP